MFRTIVFATASSALFLSSLALAQQSVAGPKPVQRSEVIKSLDAGFAAADTNHDGFLSKAELEAAEAKTLQQIQIARERQLRAEFNQLDTNHDGQLSFQEFVAAAGTFKVSETADQLMARLDRNHDGKVSAQEYRAANLRKFDEADTNHDGVVSPAEGAAYARAHQPH